MKKLYACVLLLIAALNLSAQAERKIVILHTNDIHSNLAGLAPESAYTPLTINDDKTTGGFSRLATIIKNEKGKEGSVTLAVDAGDFLMGTLFQQLEPETGFQLWLMKNIGYDVMCIGNHEFDFGPAKLADIISSAQERNGLPPLLLGNAVFSDKDPGDDALEKLFASGAVKRNFTIEREGIKIGFFSLLGKVADDNAAFASPVTFSKQVTAAKNLVNKLKNEKCDLIICLSHSGIDRDTKTGSWTGEDVDLANKVKGIDVIISGHTHTRLEEPLIINGIPIVQAGENAEWVGRLALTLKNGTVKVDSYSLLPVNDAVQGDPVVDGYIGEQKQKINEEILKPLGMEYDRKVVETDFLLECDEQGDIKGSNLGPMVADAIHRYVNTHDKGGTDISMVAVGVICDRIVPGFQCAPDIYKVMAMGTGSDNVPGYPLGKAFVTGRELKNILEALQIAYKSTPANYIYYSGINVEFNPDKGLFKKIRRISIIKSDGTVKEVNYSKRSKDLYSITANLYMIASIGIIKKSTYGLINIVLKDASGSPLGEIKNAVIDIEPVKAGIQEGKEWIAMVEFLQSMKDKNSNGIPDIDSKYREAVQTFREVR